MKRLLMLAMLVATVLMAQADPVTRQQAQQDAMAFMAGKGMAVKTEMTMALKAPRKGRVQEEAAAYYVFNNGADGGFVVVSGDDRTARILGYAEKGAFDEQDMPDNMRAWLQGYADQIAWMDNHPAEAAAGMQQARQKVAVATTRPVAPLLTCTWNQDAPYNAQCPTFVNGNASVTGCVATAMAQILYYHRAGLKAQGVNKLQADIAAYDCDRNWGSRVHVNAISAASSSLSWDNMIDDYAGGATAAQQTAVARLMAYCGAAVHMDYADQLNGGSGASDSNVPAALTTYFGCDAGLAFVGRASYTIDEWNNLMSHELMEGRPVFYGGQSSGGGHAFVVDGFDGDEMYHINWGWGGSSNGYFLLAICNPGNNSGIGASSSSDGYSMDQDAIIGIRPDAGSASAAANKVLTATLEGVSGKAVTYTFTNYSMTDRYKCGLGVVDALGNVTLVKAWAYAASELPVGRYFANVSFTLSPSDFSGLGEGIYNVVPLSQAADESWKVCNHPEDVYVEVIYDGSDIVVEAKYPEDMLADPITFPGSKLSDVEQPVHATITNLGHEYNDKLYLFASTSSTKGSYKAVAGVAIPADSETEIDFAFTPTTTGTWNIWIATDAEANNVIGYTTVSIASNSGVNNLSVLSFTADNANALNNKIVYGTTLKGSLQVKNNDSGTNANGIFVFLLASDTEYGSYSSVDYYTIPVVISGNETKEVEVSFSGLNTDKYYWLSFRYGNSSATKLGGMADWYSYNMEPGVTTYLADGTTTVVAGGSSVVTPATAVVVDMTGTGTTTVTPNSNPNTLYIIGGGETTPAGLEGKNVVKGSTASSISLTDGYDFYVPKTITVDEISYKRTPVKGTNGTGGWETLVVPFDVGQVKQGSKPLEWFKTKGESDKHLWIMDFTEIDGSTVVFDYAPTIDANVPYIIAVPDDTWGAEWDLRGKELTFYGSSVTLTPDAPMITGSPVYNFIGTMGTQSVTNTYNINAAGTKFERGNTDIAPFHAYFKSKKLASAGPQYLRVSVGDAATTAIGGLPVVSEQLPVADAAIFDVQGHRLNQLQRGLNIVRMKDGTVKKIAVK